MDNILSILNELITLYPFKLLTRVEQYGSIQHLRFIPEDLDITCNNPFYTKTNKIPLSSNPQNLERVVFCEFSAQKSKGLKLRIVGSTNQAKNIISNAKMLNTNNVFNKMEVSGNQNYFHFHQENIFTNAQYTELINNPDYNSIIKIFKTEIPKILDKLYILFP